jgi:DNA-binding SARP family transcriptional activator/nucleoid-associated protein YgaU
MSRLAALVRGLGSFLVLVALLFGIPFALWRSVGWPLPHAIPTWGQLKAGLTAHGIPDEVLFKILACVCWVAWIGLVASVTTEAGAVIRGKAARRLPLLGFLQPLAANLVATLALVVLVASSRPQQARVVPLPVAFARYQPAVVAGVMAADGRDGGAPSRVDRDERTESRSYLVARHDTLWGIAERELGDPLRWREIYRLNEGRPQPDGRSVDDPNQIYPGWSLRLPESARAQSSPEASSQTPSHAATRRASSNFSQGSLDAYRVRPGDSLWDIAERELGDGHLWRDIYEMNRGRALGKGQRLEDPDLIRSGWVLRLPHAQPVQTNGGHHSAERHPGPSKTNPTPTPTPSHAGGNGRPSRAKHSPIHTPAPTEAPASPPTKVSPPSVGLPAGALIAGTTAMALLAAAAVATRRRRSRRLDFFTDGPAIPPPAEAFVSLLRHRLRGAETDRVSVAVERLARAWEEADSEPLVLLGCVEGLKDVKVILKVPSQDSLERIGPKVADALGCTVEARDVGDDIDMLTLTDLDAGSVSFLPGVRPRFPLLLPLGAIGSSVLHVNLAAVTLTIAGPEAEDAALAVGVAAAAKASPRHLRLAVDATLGESAQRLQGLPHAEERWADVGVEAVTEVRRRQELARSEGARDFDELAREAPDVVLPRVLAITATDADLPEGGALGIHVLHVRSTGSNKRGGTVVADHGSLHLSSEVSGRLGLGTNDITLTPFHLRPGQIEAGVELLTDAFPPTEAPASEQTTETPGTSTTTSPAAVEEKDPSPVVTPMIEAHGDAQLSAPSYPVEIRCLGTLRVLADGKEVSRGRSKSFELLARLALRPGENVGRERTAEELWPEMDPEIQNERLGDAVSGVRQMLRSGLADEREFLQREPGAYRLNPDLVWVDVTEFEHAVQTGRSRDDAAGLDALRHAIDLYRGDLLEDRYYEWTEPEARRLRDQCLGTLLLLAERLTDAGDLVGALDAANRGLALEPLSEAFHARAMRVYAAQDRRDAVVAHYREAARRLEAEGLEPPEELRVLANEMLGGRSVERSTGSAISGFVSGEPNQAQRA